MQTIMLNNELFNTFGFWSSVLVIKILLMAVLTANQRTKKNIFSNPEDLAFGKKGKAKISTEDPDVERVRRAHRNDLENCLPWLIMTFVWLHTNPTVYIAKILISTFVISRIVHTISYAILAQQPTRAIAFFVGYGITLYEAIATMYHFF